ncbi:MAG: capsular polysaccharide biosynthesis protein [Verrucomicrobiota bacterium]
MKQELQGEAAWIYRKVLSHPLLSAFLQQQEPDGKPIHVGWGYRPSGRAASQTARRKGGRLLLLEDSFVRSIRTGHGSTVYGVIADSSGIHYDPESKSDLLTALDSGQPVGWMRKDPEVGDPEKLMARFREIGASKYNWFPGEYRDEPLPEKEGILVVDQSRGDAAIRHGGLAVSDFDRMLRDALDTSDGSPVYVRAHPDHLFRKKHSCFSQDLLSDARVKLLSPDLSPAQCFTFCPTVMVGSSLMGMEALIHGRKVITYGRPFFAGRGLTEDHGKIAPLRAVGLTGLFEAACLRYGHYFDPDTQEPCGLGEILDHLALQKEMFRRNRGRSVTVGFSPWKRKIVTDYLRSPAGELTQVNELAETRPDARLLVWGRKPQIDRANALRVEDGFIRSKGLGAAFNFPYSWVLDSRGIYFDAGAPSNLEELLNQGFSDADLAEARELIGILREKRLTKYNLTGDGVSLDAKLVNGRKVILAPGQVEADASIAFGSPEIKSNIELLRRIRAAEPDAFLIFKAHPDLVAGARHGNVLPAGFAEACDLAVTEGNVLDWLDVCDEVHTMTSTVGFEALIREKPVVTYGIPFYAAWGLTTDRLECPRRQRKLTLEELVCGALMKYPRYLNPATGEFTTALKVTRLLTSDSVAGDQRALHLRTVSILKKLWVESARKSNQA